MSREDVEKQIEEIHTKKKRCVGKMIASVLIVLFETGACAMIWNEKSNILLFSFATVGFLWLLRGVYMTHLYFKGSEIEEALKKSLAP